MKKIILLLVLFGSVKCISQNKQILYNFTSIPQSLMTNPGADVKYKWYFGIPLLSGVYAHGGSTGFSPYDLFANDGVDFNVKLRNVVSSISKKDHVAINEQLEIFSGGFKVGDWDSNSYVSFGMYQEFDFLSYMPKDLAILALYGNRDYIGKSFDLGDLNGKTEMLSTFHVGYHKQINEDLIIGVRGKIYSSAFNANSTRNSGYFYTIPSPKGGYEQVIYSDMELNTSGISEYTKDEYSGNVAKDIIKKTFFGGDLGLGFDAGLTYYPKKNIQITASLVDIGFITHTKDVESFRYKGYYKYEGVNPKFTTPNSAESVYQEFKDAIPLDTLHSKYTTWRPAKFNSSFQYSFEESRDSDCNCEGNDLAYKNNLGAQLFVMSTPRTPFRALTAFYKRNFSSNLQLKATYTIDSYSYSNIGLGLSSNIGPVNLYILADNLLEYRDVSKANSLSFQFGLNILFKESNDSY